MNAPTVELPAQLAQQILDYLSGRPYIEVAQLIAQLLRCGEQAAEQKAQTTAEPNGDSRDRASLDAPS